MPDPADTPLQAALQHVQQRLRAAASDARRPLPQLLPVSKHQAATAVAALAQLLRAAGHADVAMGENYVQEATDKQGELQDSGIAWHMIGHLQSNKARQAATTFDWVQTVDRASLVTALARHRPTSRAPLQVLLQVNIDDEASKHGCAPGAIAALAAAVVAERTLCLRGLMAIPAPHPDIALRRAAFARMRQAFEALQAAHPRIDTLSMGMSDDIELAVAEGATMVRVGTALFGAR